MVPHSLFMRLSGNTDMLETQFVQKQWLTGIEQGQQLMAPSTKLRQDSLQMITASESPPEPSDNGQWPWMPVEIAAVRWNVYRPAGV